MSKTLQDLTTALARAGRPGYVVKQDRIVAYWAHDIKVRILSRAEAEDLLRDLRKKALRAVKAVDSYFAKE